MKSLNILNGAEPICLDCCTKLIDEFTTQLIGVEMGIAWGGGVEKIGKLWRDKGIVYGFDTFEGHPKQLGVTPEAHETTCMDYWYNTMPVNELSYEYQREELDKQGLSNVILVKGLINKDSCKNIPYINYALLDLDMIKSMRTGYAAVKDKIVKGGYLFLHDVSGHEFLPELHDWYINEVLKDEWEIVGEYHSSYLACLRKP